MKNFFLLQFKIFYETIQIIILKVDLRKRTIVTLLIFLFLYLVAYYRTYGICFCRCSGFFWQYNSKINISKFIDFVPADYTFIQLQYNSPINQQEDFFKYYKNPKYTLAWNQEARQLNQTYIEAYQVYVNGIGGFSIENNFYTMRYFPCWKNVERLRNFTGNVVSHYPHVIVLGYNECIRKFGHLVEDFFQPFVLLPQEVISTAHVLCAGFQPVFDEFLDIFSIPQERRIKIKKSDWIACDKIYTYINPLIYLNFYGIATKQLKILFHETYKLDNITATRYYLGNRGYYKPRYVHNFDEVCNSVRLRFPNIKWEILTDDCYSLSDAAKAWSSVKFLFAPTGSNIVKCIFMKDKTFIICIGTHMPDYSIAMFTTACNIYSIHYFGLRCMHLSGNGTSINAELAVKMINYGIDFLQTHKWPQNSGL